MTRHICIHGHFYQPPRENPWLEEVELQDSAHPFHDWNERINAECYTHNAASRIVDGDGWILNIVNNYAKISFNFGPTLLSWLEKKDPGTYRQIIEADAESREHFSGHGSALAQAYNHMIMPLANSRDKRTQVIWGIRDFEHRFGRKPEGMWLSETAVDLDTLDILADQEIRFTILAPRQAHRVRRIGEKSWTDVSGDRIDPKFPYLCRLPSGKTISLFFYDGPISQGIAFEGLLKSGETFAKRLTSVFSEDGEGGQLVHIATDGETYGHHHKWGGMALAFCLQHIESHDLARITIYGEYLENHPPQHEVEIFENSSWSCIHGVERWKSDCGCCSGMNPGWNQAWRPTLRGAMDWLRDSLVDVYQNGIAPYVRDPWLARDDYIEVVLNRTPETIEQFLAKHQAGDIPPADRAQVLKLLEMQRHAMLMYTSCGWFFDEISGIETVQVMRYAARAMQLARETAGVDLEPAYVAILARAQSNIPRLKDGAKIYEDMVRPVALDLLRVGAHYAISSLFKSYPQKFNICCYTAESSDYEQLEMGLQKLALGKARIQSDITLEEGTISFAVLHLGEHNFIGGGKHYEGNNDQEIHHSIKEDFLKGDISSVITAIERYYETHDFGLWHLFRDEQWKVMERIMDKTLHAIEPDFRKVYESYLPLLLATQNLRIPLPKIFSSTVEFILNDDLVKALAGDGIDLENLRKAVDEFKRWAGHIEMSNMNFLTSRKINEMMVRLGSAEGTESLPLLAEIEAVFDVLTEIEVELDLWKAQNVYFDLINNDFFSNMKARADQGEAEAEEWVGKFIYLGDRLKLRAH